MTWDLRNLPVVSGKDHLPYSTPPREWLSLGTSLCTFTGYQPIHVIVKDQGDEYFMDVLVAHR